ncbi:hypothetical protein SAMN04487958_110115 [Vreelandella subterranea]|uniref:Uncharacterized protein n=1 Tax=Vreelandella subterranea TaxID=416874 RepID=A0A1H9VS21_9GAMM|nr:hypothetical protein [Halomonas subterranea]SES24339.1 hypothetical protein SAMN04487958_110115 [Halomonas subterranea]
MSVTNLFPPQPDGFHVLDKDAQLYRVFAMPLPDPEPGVANVALHIIGVTVETRLELHLTDDQVRNVQRELQTALNQVNGGDQ